MQSKISEKQQPKKEQKKHNKTKVASAPKKLCKICLDKFRKERFHKEEECHYKNEKPSKGLSEKKEEKEDKDKKKRKNRILIKLLIRSILFLSNLSSFPIS